MKKILCLLLVTVCGLMLWSCTIPGLNTNQTPTCTVHVDANSDLRCDTCGVAVECTNHVDENENLTCDLCGAEIECDHDDADNDGECDTPGCDYVFCEHEYDEEYSYDDDYHYFEPICDCDIEPKDKEEHADEDNDGVCDVCEWDYDHKHTYETTWSQDDDNHWHKVTCSHDVEPKDKAPHVDANKDSICDTCEWDYDHEHTYSEDWSHDEKDHWHAPSCGHEVEGTDKAAHADENNDGVCDGCAWNYDHEHEYDETTWKTDEENHWHEAKCEHDVPNKDLAAHEDGDDDGLCDVCKFVTCDNHVMSDKWESNATTHWRPSVCGHENAGMEAAGHSFDDNYYCDTCGHQHAHAYAEEWKFDAEYHWHESICGEDGVIHDVLIDEKVAHTDENNDGVCEVCEKQFCQHTYSEDWTHDKTHHWHAATCGHDVEGKDKAEHTDDNNDSICEGCQWDFDHEHEYGTWEYDENEHWTTILCGHNIAAKAPHADENNDGVCDACSWDYDHDHTYDTENWTYDNEYHWHAPSCTHTIEGIDKAAHTDEDNNGVCEVCEHQFCQHTEFATEYSKDDTGHWYAATCGHVDAEGKLYIKDFVAHDANVDTNNDGICDTCEHQFCQHAEFATEYSKDDTGHWYAATCGHVDAEGKLYIKDFVAHDASVDANNDGICDICLHQFCQHDEFATEYSKDDTGHWYAATCGHVDAEGKLYIKDFVAHDANSDVNNDGICNACEHQFCQHTYEDEWTIDGTHHWKAAICGHDVELKEAHLDENNDGVCETCEKQFCEHYSTEWAQDENNHWHDKFCDHDVAEKSEEGTHADTDLNEVCDGCEHFYHDPNADYGSADENEGILTDPDYITPQS